MQPFPHGSSGAPFETPHPDAVGLCPAGAGPGAKTLLPWRLPSASSAQQLALLSTLRSHLHLHLWVK